MIRNKRRSVEHGNGSGDPPHRYHSCCLGHILSIKHKLEPGNVEKMDSMILSYFW